LRAFPANSAERECYQKDVEKINDYLKNEVDAKANGLAIFACSAADLFEAIQLEAPIDNNYLFINEVPNLYVLERVRDQYPRYAALVLDTNMARLYIFGLARTEQETTVQNEKTRGTVMGGWSQARYQRHIGNYHLQHAKEVVDTLEKVVQQEGIQHIIIGGDAVIVPTIRDQMPKHLQEKIVDILPLDIRTPEHEILATTLEKMREEDARTDAEKCERMYSQYKAGGLAVAGADDTLAALGIGQVDELLIAAQPQNLEDNAQFASKEDLASALVTAAKQTSAKVTFIEDPTLLENAGGVGALLRFRI
jgi:peptide chain release factor subunit 1